MRDSTDIGSDTLVRIMQAVRAIEAGEHTPGLLSDLAGNQDELRKFSAYRTNKRL